MISFYTKPEVIIMLKSRGFMVILFFLLGSYLWGQQITLQTFLDQVDTPYQLFVADTAKTHMIAASADEPESYLASQGYRVIYINAYQRLVVPADMIFESKVIANRNNTAAKKQGYLTLGEKSNQTSCQLEGLISDSNTGMPIIGATLYNAEDGSGTVSDANGSFKLECNCGDKLSINVESIGYKLSTFKLRLLSDVNHHMILYQESEMIDEVVISTRTVDNNVQSSITGLSKLSIQEIKTLPSLLGEPDVIKSLLTLSGVTNAGEGSGGVNVRGGNADQNLILLDDMTFFNPTHSFGFFSALHPEMIAGLDLYKGLMPSNYGGRLSSVLQAHSNSGDFKKWKGKIGLGLLATKAFVEGPILKDKTSFAAAVRLSHINWLLKQIGNTNVNQSRTNFYDVHGKVTHRFSSKLKLDLQGYQSNDGFLFANQFDLDYKTSNASIAINYLATDRFSVNISGALGKYDSQLKDLLSNDPVQLSTGIDKLSTKTELIADLGGEWIAKAGLEYVHHTVNPGELNNEANDLISSTQEQYSTELSPYATLSGSVVERFNFTVGVRMPFYKRLGSYEEAIYIGNPVLNQHEGNVSFADGETVYNFNQLEPRVGLTVKVQESLSLKLSYNRTSQFISQISNTASPTPIDFWMVSNRYVKPMTAKSYSLGLYKNWKEDKYETSIEGYYKDIDNVTETIDFADVIANPMIETQLLQGIGKTYGVEANLAKSTGKFTGKVNYTYSRSLRQIQNENPNLEINNGDWYAANFDKPHVLNFNMKYVLGKRASFSAAFTYSTGRPVTVPISVYDNFNVPGIYVFSERNAFRIPDYHRLDLVFDYFPNIKKNRRYKTFWSFGLYNVYGRRNAYSVFFEQANGAPPRANSLSIIGVPLPSITLNIEFE